MEFKQQKLCQRGHYYDPSQYLSCPHCGTGVEIKPTTPKSPGVGITDTLPPTGSQGKPAPLGAELGRTIGVIRKKLGIDPVVGWLVCIEGADRGRDYRIHSERNPIGRSPTMDICINGDDTISRDSHAVVSFDPRRGKFRLHAGEGRGLVYLNEDPVDGSMELKPYDVIELGQTKLMFIPFCGERFQWTQGTEGNAGS